MNSRTAISVVIAGLLIVGAGCAQGPDQVVTPDVPTIQQATPESMQPVISPEEPVAKVTPPAETKTVPTPTVAKPLDSKANWVKETGLPGVTFSHPPELTFVTNTPILGGTWSHLVDESGVKKISFFNDQLIKCPLPNGTGCTSLDMFVPATPAEFYADMLEINRLYANVEEIQLGNTTGVKVINKSKPSDYVVDFASSKGVFQIEDRDQNSNGTLFQDILKTIMVE